MHEDMGGQQAIAEVAVNPVMDDPRREAAVAAAVEALRGPELELSVGPLSTVVVGRFDDIVHAVQRAHRAAAADAPRVVTTLRIETKRGGVDAAGRRAEAEAMQPDDETVAPGSRQEPRAPLRGPME